MLNPNTIINHIQNGGTFSIVGKYGVDKYKIVIPRSSINGEPVICHIMDDLTTITPQPKEVFEYICKREGYYKDVELILD